MVRLSSLGCSARSGRLVESIHAAPLRGLAILLAIAGLAAYVGCSPSDNEHKRSAQDSQLAHSASSAQSQASAGSKNARGTEPSGNIPVDQDGFVTFGQTPEQAAEPSPAQTTEPASDALEISAERARGATADQPPTSSVSLGEPTPAEPDASASSAAAEKSSKNSTHKAKASGLELTIAPSSGNVKAQTVSTEAEHPREPEHSSESGLATYDERHQKIAEDWPKPQAVLFLTGQQHGYIEPCGCTGLENQKGGLNRRDTLLKLLQDRGWETVPMDVGNFERRVGRQAEIKFQTTVEALKDMHYRAATLGVDDLKLSSTHLLSLTATEGKTETPFISANAYILIEEYMPKSRIIEVGGRKIGVTAVLGDSFRKDLSASEDVMTAPAAESLRPVLKELKEADCDYLVLLAHATDQESRQLAQDVPGFDLVVTAGGFPEPPYELEPIEGTHSKMAQVGAKGMYTVLIGLYPDSDQPVRYQRIALSSQFADSPRMLERFANYQKQLESLGFQGLGLRAATHPTGREFVGSETCGQCHTKAFEVWKESKHFTATESLIKPPNDRSMIPRHHDPECLSCHVTGWNPQHYYPYATGYLSLEKTPMLTGSGCENCHGPGSAHAAAENGDVEADDELLAQLREQMRLPLAEARAKCTECHDQDNSPDFQHDGAFEKYWEQIAHPGKD